MKKQRKAILDYIVIKIATSDVFARIDNDASMIHLEVAGPIMKNPRKAGQSDLQLGRQLAALRKSAGVTQAVLAAELGISVQQLGKYERGVNRIGKVRYDEALVFLAARTGQSGFAETPLPYDDGPRIAAQAQHLAKVRALLAQALRLLEKS